MAIQTLRSDAVLKIDTAPIKQDAKTKGTVSSLDQHNVLRNKEDADHFKSNDTAPSFKTQLAKEERPRPAQEKFLSRDNNAPKNLKNKNIPQDDSDRSDPSYRSNGAKSVETPTKKSVVKSQEESSPRPQHSQDQGKLSDQESPPPPQGSGVEVVSDSELPKNTSQVELKTTLDAKLSTEVDILSPFSLAHMAPPESPIPQLITTQFIPINSSEDSSERLEAKPAEGMASQSPSGDPRSITAIMESSYEASSTTSGQDKSFDVPKTEAIGSTQTNKTENTSFLEITGRSYSANNTGTPPQSTTSFQPTQLLTTSQTLTLHEDHDQPLFREINDVDKNGFSEVGEADREVFAPQPAEITTPKSKSTSSTGIPAEVTPAEGTELQGNDMKSSQPGQTIHWDNKTSGTTSLPSSSLSGATQTLIEDAGFQVAQSFRDAIQLRKSDFEIKLTPEGLGQVHIRIHFDKKSVEANFTVEPSSLPYFQKHAHAITAIFEANGFHSEQNGLTFSMHQGNTGQGSTHHGNSQQNQGTEVFQIQNSSTFENFPVRTVAQNALFNRQLNTHNPHGTFAVDI